MCIDLWSINFRTYVRDDDAMLIVSKREREKKLCEEEEFLGEGHSCASLSRNCIQWYLTLEGEDHGNCITTLFTSRFRIFSARSTAQISRRGLLSGGTFPRLPNISNIRYRNGVKRIQRIFITSP
jgi:hypothetical protein